MEEWLVYNKRADFAGIAKEFHIDPVTARIIRNRDIVDKEQIRRFLQGGIDDLYNPHLMKDADKLCDILLQKIEEGKSIRIIGDYDIDGVMSSFILYSALERIGGKASVAIPHRMLDGYGLNANIIELAKEDGIDTIITCDNGIAAIKEIELAKSYGMTVLVTDHHEVAYNEEAGEKKYILPKADAVVNPHQKDCQYPYKDLCGAAVAWKMVCILYERKHIAFEEAAIFLENVAFATVGDIVSLTDENRILVKEGLKRIHRTSNLGMKALIAQCGIEKEHVNAYHFGFVLGPCINASGRLDTAKRSLELFLCKEVTKAATIAAELVGLNEERKEMTQKGVERAIEMCEEETYKKDSVLVLYLPEIHESIAGIIAGRVRETYNKPTFILTKGEECIKGSGRSIEAYSMYEEMIKCKDLFLKFGGHPMAAGLSLAEENVDLFREKINELCKLEEKDFHPVIHIDVPMPMDYVSMELVDEFECLAPFGKDNSRPVFADRNLRIMRLWIIGKKMNVLRMELLSEAGIPLNGIYFGDIQAMLSYLEQKYSKESVDNALHGKINDMTLSCIYSPSINRYRDMESLQFEIQHYK